MTTTTDLITEPGVYDIPESDYHADPVAGGSLSSSGARKLLPPSCPAKFDWHRRNGEEHAGHFDFGKAAHQLVLGAGAPIVRVDAESWRTKAAREARDAAYEAGEIPLLAADHDQVLAMAAALAEHPIARALFNPGRGRPEQTLVWQDDRTGVWCRARLDWLPDTDRSGRVIIADYKTCHSADPDALSRSVAQFGYHQQAAWYLAGMRALGLAGDDAAFVFLCQEKQAPWLVSPIELDHVAMRIGEARNRRALDIYRHCTDTGRWPPYVDGIHLLSLPRWAEIEEGEHLL